MNSYYTNYNNYDYHPFNMDEYNNYEGIYIDEGDILPPKKITPQLAQQQLLSPQLAQQQLLSPQLLSPQLLPQQLLQQQLMQQQLLQQQLMQQQLIQQQLLQQQLAYPTLMQQQQLMQEQYPATYPQAYPYPYSNNNPYITVPASNYNNIEILPKNTFSNGLKHELKHELKHDYKHNPDFHGHFSIPIRSGDPDRKIISKILAATSWDERPEEFDGDNVYNNWMHSGTQSNSQKNNFTNNNINSNNYSYGFILKVILFIILIVLVVILCIVASRKGNYNKKFIRPDFEFEDD